MYLNEEKGSLSASGKLRDRKYIGGLHPFLEAMLLILFTSESKSDGLIRMCSSQYIQYGKRSTYDWLIGNRLGMIFKI